MEVEKFQEGIKDHLNNGCNEYKWEIEQKAKVVRRRTRLIS